jgi:exosortase A-associated hydrolase 2
MNPFYFGTRQRRLFGIYEPAVFGSMGKRAAVLCHPWGSEYLHAYRTMRQLAIKLSVAGFHTLRFDFFGTGDSAGEMTEADLKGWETDVELAMEELKEIVGVAQVALIGLRVGATLAAKVAARCPKEVNALVLWDPVVSGQEYLQSLCAAYQPNAYRLDSALAESEYALEEHALEIRGDLLTANMMRDFQAIDIFTLISALPTRTLVVVTERLASHEKLRTILTARAAGSLGVEHIASVRPWIEDYADTGAIPASVIQRIVKWLG